MGWCCGHRPRQIFAESCLPHDSDCRSAAGVTNYKRPAGGISDSMFEELHHVQFCLRVSQTLVQHIERGSAVCPGLCEFVEVGLGHQQQIVLCRKLDPVCIELDA